MEYAASTSVPPESVLFFASTCLEALGNAKRAKRRQDRSAGLWDKAVPGSRPVVDLLRSYAMKDNSLTLKANDIEVGYVALAKDRPIVLANGVEVFLKYRLFGGEETLNRSFVPFPNATAAAFCRGGWVDLKIARVRLGSLIPDMEMDGDTLVLRWQDCPGIELGEFGWFGLIRKWTRTSLSEFRIGPDYGEFVADGLADWVLPRLVWR